MKNYIKYLVCDLIVILILGGLIFAISAVNKRTAEVSVTPRTNTECKITERVFDYADKLTDEQEQDIRTRIASAEQVIQADILLVTLNEEMSDHDVMVYSDDFQDEEAFGYNEPYGNCAMLVDNWATGYMWFHTAGNIMEEYDSDSKINYLLDEICENVNIDTYGAYCTYIDTLVKQMQKKDSLIPHVPLAAVLGFALLVTGIFLFIKLYKVGARKTTVANTYMKDHTYEVRHKEDQFLSKNVTKRRIETSSGGSGGGVHTSGGGHSYGGGGRHH